MLSELHVSWARNKEKNVLISSYKARVINARFKKHCRKKKREVSIKTLHIKFCKNPFTYSNRESDRNNKTLHIFVTMSLTSVSWLHGRAVRPITNFQGNSFSPCPMDSADENEFRKKVVKFDIDRCVQCYVHYWCVLAEKTKTRHATAMKTHASSLLPSSRWLQTQ